MIKQYLSLHPWMRWGFLILGILIILLIAYLCFPNLETGMPVRQVVDGMTLKLDNVQVCDDNRTHLDYSVDQRNWRLKRVTYCGYRATPTELTWKTYDFPGEFIDPPLWSSHGPYHLDLGFREEKDFYYREEDGPNFVEPPSFVVPAPGKSVLSPYDCTAFGATLHMIGAFGTGASIPGTGQTAASPCLAFTIQGEPKVTFTVMTTLAYAQPYLSSDQIDFPSPQACVQFPLKERSQVFIFALGSKERVYHFYINTPRAIGLARFISIN